MPFIFSFRNYYVLLCCDSVEFLRLFIAHEIRRKEHRPILDFDYAQRIKYYLKKNPDHDITNWLNGKNLDGSDFCDKYKGLLERVGQTQDRSILKITNKMPFEHPKKCRLACHCVSVDTNDLLKAGVLTTLYNGKIKMREEALRCMFCRTLYYGVCDNKDHFKNRNVYIKKLKDYYGFDNSNVDLHKDCYPVLTAGDKLAWLYGNVFSVTQSDLEGLAIEMLFDYNVIQTDIEKERFPEHYRDRLFPITIRCEDCTNFTKKALIIRETSDLIPVEDVVMRITGDLHLAQYPQRDDLVGDDEAPFGRVEDFVYRPVSPVEDLNLTFLQHDADARGSKRKDSL